MKPTEFGFLRSRHQNFVARSGIPMFVAGPYPTASAGDKIVPTLATLALTLPRPQP
jgi:hypothetical protein